jgi:hypothetical protein
MPSVSGYLVPQTCGVIRIFHRRFGVSYLIQFPKAMPLKFNKRPAPSSSQSPQAPVRYACVQDPSEAAPGGGLCFSAAMMMCPATLSLAGIRRPPSGERSATRRQRRLCPWCPFSYRSKRGPGSGLGASPLVPVTWRCNPPKTQWV